jgi:hypothetical protein
MNRLVRDAARHSKETMNKRLEKRHKRQVSRARARVKVQEPDVRTPEEIAAAREASRPDPARGSGSQGLFARQQVPRSVKPPAEVGVKKEA